MKTLKDIKKEFHTKHHSSTYDFETRWAINMCSNKLRESAKELIKELKCLINDYLNPSTIFGEANEPGSFWGTKEGKLFKHYVNLGIISFDDDGVFIEGFSLFEHFFNLNLENNK